jgi:hypothetical protein
LGLLTWKWIDCLTAPHHRWGFLLAYHRLFNRLS